MKKRFLGLIGLLTLAVVFSSCSGKKAAAVEQQKKPLVKVVTSTLEPIDQQAEFTGSITPYAINNISPSMGIRIDKINVEVGDKVSRGKVLVEMDKQQYLQSEVQKSNLESDYLRTKKLYEQGGVSKQQLDGIETQLSVIKHATQNLKENTTLISPINGIVSERMFDQGDIYSMQTGRILTVIQIDKVKVLIHVSEQYFPFVKVGMPVDILLDVYPNEKFAGKVTLIHPALDAATRTFSAEITIPNQGTRLRPGMFSRVMLNFGKSDMVMVPDVAIQKQQGSNERFVFIVNDGIAERRTVKPGRIIGKKQEVLSGIAKGESVVIAGGQKLLDQSQVEITK